MADLAERQHGVVARWQLLELGMTRRVIGGRLRRGSLHEAFRGIYVVGTPRMSRRGRWMAAVLTAGDVAVLSHRTAAALWRLLPERSGAAEITCRPGRVVRRSGIVCHESPLRDDEWEVVDGIPVTAPFRTIFDLAAVADERQIERAWHEALVRGLRAKVSLPALLERYPSRRGARILRALLRSQQPAAITRNDFEEEFLALADRTGLPRPRMNAAVALRGSFFEIDCLWEREQVAVELDSRSVHGTPRKFESDRRRDRILVADGWRTMRVTWRQLRDEPASVAADLGRALSSL